MCTIPSVFTQLLGPNSSVGKASDFLTEPSLQPLESLVWRFGLGAGHVDLLKILADDFHAELELSIFASNVPNFFAV